MISADQSPPSLPLIQGGETNHFSHHSLGSGYAAFWIIASVFLLSRLFLLNINQAEFTDGYLILNWNISDPSRWHPLYPILVKIFASLMDPVIAGRLVSILAGVLTLLPLAYLTEILYGRKAALYACCFFTASAQILWADTRVLTESLFVFLSLTSVYFWVRIGFDRSALAWFVLVSGLAVLTRPEALVFAPLVLMALYQAVRTSAAHAYRVIAASVSWILFAFWSSMNSHDNYRDVMVQNLVNLDWEALLTRVVAYLDIYPYMVFYPLFVLAMYGLIARYSKQQKQWLFIVTYLHLCWVAMLAVHTSWSTRFLIFPATLLLLPAGGGVDHLPVSRRTTDIVVATLLVVLSAFSLTALYLQRQTFVDFRNVAKCAANRSTEARIFSDENIKTEYYLKRPVEVYSRSQLLRDTDIVILHSFNTDLVAEVEYLKGKYELDFICMNESEVVSLLANGIVEKNEWTNSPAIVEARFTPQQFLSVALIVDK